MRTGRCRKVHVEPAERDLIAMAATGDSQAFERLIAPYEKRLYALCLRICANREDALDCAQEVMLRIWRSIPKYRFQASLSTWCYRIATNTCLDLLRKQKFRPSVSLDALTEDGFAPANETEDKSDPQAYSEADARKRALEEGIASLPPDMRAALVLRDIQGFSYEEIADILTLPIGTVKSRINRSREKLRQSIMEKSGNLELFGNTSVQSYEGRRQA